MILKKVCSGFPLANKRKAFVQEDHAQLLTQSAMVIRPHRNRAF
jgi:hypothetical protein